MVRILSLGVFFLTTTAVTAEDIRSLSADRAARQYRIQVYETYRGERDKYDHRIEVGRELLAAWIQAGQPKEVETQLSDWFLAARDASRAELVAELPPLPEIDFAQFAQQTPVETLPGVGAITTADGIATPAPSNTATDATPAITGGSQNLAAEPSSATSSNIETSPNPEVDTSDLAATPDSTVEGDGGEGKEVDGGETAATTARPPSTLQSLGGALWRAATD